jgi:hypothetical protein
MRAELPAQVVELVDAFRDPLKQIDLLYLLAEASILEPVVVDAETAARMVRPYAWFLDRVGADGIKLSGHGWLPPADVEAAVAELGLGGKLAGPGNGPAHRHADQRRAPVRARRSVKGQPLQRQVTQITGLSHAMPQCAERDDRRTSPRMP